MLSNYQKEKLKRNWGDKADNLQCNAEVRVYDPLSKWQCFIYSMNPENDDEIECILNGFGTETCKWTLEELFNTYNAHGERVQVDDEFRPKCAMTILKYLKDKEYYEFYRN